MRLPIPSALLLTALLSACGTSTTPAPTYAGQIYAQTNGEAGNAIVQYGRRSDGTLVKLGQTGTGGLGSGDKLVVIKPGKAAVDPLFSSDSVVLSADHKRLFAVNAASGSVSSFVLDAAGTPTLVGHYDTGAANPTSLSLSGTLLYVGHASASAAGVQISGFRVQPGGSLVAVGGATYAPTAPTVVTQVKFSPDARFLLSSELMNGKLTLYPVTAAGTLGAAVPTASAGAGPFSAAWLDQSHVLVAEAMGGSVSSYAVSDTGALTPVSAAVANGQKATCWLKVTPDGRYVYAANTTSGSISVYRVGANAALTLVNANAASLAPEGAVDFMDTPASGPVDLVISADGKFLYQQFSGLGKVAAYAVGTDGSLTPVAGGDATGLPLGTEGLAGY